MPKLYTAAPHLLPYPSSGSDLVAEGDDILRELAARLQVIIGPPSGSAGGDLGGTYPNPQVVTINGVAVSAVVFTDDARLTNARPPSGVAGGDLAGSTYPNPVVATINGRAKTAVVFTDDARLSDARGPSAHAATHRAGGTDELATNAAAAVQVRDVGEPGQVRAGRPLTLADFTVIGLAAPLGLWNLANVNDTSGNARHLTNKGAVPFGPGIMGAATEAAIFAGSTAQALYIDNAAWQQIATGSWGCWFRTAKRGTQQVLFSKWLVAGGRAYSLDVATSDVVSASISTTGADSPGVTGATGVVDDRWHHVVATHDGSTLRLYVDGVLDGSGAIAGPIFAAASPLDLGVRPADATNTAAGSLPHFGRIDEAFLTADVLSDDQVRNLYCARLAHTLAVTPAAVRLAVRRRRRGGALATTDFPATPVRLYNLTGGSGADQGSGNVTIANTGGATPMVAGADGARDGALALSAGSHLQGSDAGLPAGVASRSYGLWVKTTSAGGPGVLGWGTAGTADARLVIAASPDGAIAAKSAADVMTGPVIADGLWHHVVVVEDNAPADGVKRKLYVDGRQGADSAVLNSLTLAGANRFRVGADPDGTAPLTGQVDGAFVYAGALTPEQVRSLYNVGSQGLAPSPKNPGDHVEALEAASLLATFDTLGGCDQVDLSVAA